MTGSRSKALVFDLPASSGLWHDGAISATFSASTSSEVRKSPLQVVFPLPLCVENGQIESIDGERILGIAQWGSDEPAIAPGAFFAFDFSGQRHFLRRCTDHEISERDVGCGFGGEQKITARLQHGLANCNYSPPFAL